MRLLMCSAGLLALAACGPTVPDSAAGVGFGDYTEYQARQQSRDQALNNNTDPVTGAYSLDPDLQARQANSGEQPLEADPQNPAPVVVNSVGISGENDFDAVAAERSIEGDAARIAQNREQYKVIEPTALPLRPGSDQPNIVEYAVQTTNPVGVSLYRRSSLTSDKRHQRNCSVYRNADDAQTAFLELGGPEKDRKTLDPDGDGFACSWDPTLFRLARGN